ncbi:MAG: PAS domain S-box-containing protein, partial [Myxococcota bacterium]
DLRRVAIVARTEKLALEALRREQRSWFSLSLDLICVATFEGYFTQLNPSWEQALGWSLDELMARPFIDFVHPDDRERTIVEAGQLALGTTTISFDNRYETKHGEYRWLRWTANADLETETLYAAARDVTDQKATELELRRMVEIVELTPDLVGVMQVDGTPSYVNQAGRRMLGLEALDPLPQSFTEWHPAGVAARIKSEGIQEAREKGVWTGETEIVARDGTVTPVLQAIVAHESDQGETEFISTIARDITDRKRLELLKDEFISTVNHELRTPLTSIRGSLGLIVGGVVGDVSEGVRDMLEIATSNTDRLVRLINDMLDLQKIESGRLSLRPRVQRIRGLVAQSVEANQAYASKYSVRFEVFDHEDDWARLDGDRIVQVLDNLLSNAAKFSPAGSVVSVSVEREGDEIVTRVRDRGAGVPDEVALRIFERFTQADSSSTRPRDGTGLGLSICKSLVELHGGKIGFDTIAGEGSCFWFRVEACEVPTEVLVSEVVPGRVLIVEDDPDVACILRTMLAKNGFTSEVASTAEEALGRLETEPFAALTVDIGLPGTDGIELLRRLGRDPRLAVLPVVVVSARCDESRERLKGGVARVMDWIDKPVDEGRLADAVHRCVQPTGHILHVEDDADVAAVVAEALRAFRVTTAPTLALAREALRKQTFDALILDLALPDGEGFELLDDLQSMEPAIPVIVFSASDVSDTAVHRIEAALVKSRHGGDELASRLSQLLRTQRA